MAVVAVAAALLLAIQSVQVAVADTYKYLAVPSVRQTQPNWCWAASNQSIIKFRFGWTFAQCTQANEAFGRSDCCTNPSGINCNKGNTLPSVQAINAGHGISTQIAGALGWSSITQEIGTYSRPFMAAIYWTSGGGHAVVVRGYETEGTVQKYVSVMDPWDGLFKEYTFAYFTSNSSFYWGGTLWRYTQ